ncbi:hypothetical protein ACFL0V_06660 [Nanoarchaeota archaeon]
MLKRPAIKKVLSKFFLDESGSFAKKTAISVGLITSILSSSAEACSDHHAEDYTPGGFKTILYKDQDPLGVTNTADWLSRSVHLGSCEGCNNNHRFNLFFTWQDLVDLKVANFEVTDDFHIINGQDPREDMDFVCPVTDHLDWTGYTDCNNHFSSRAALQVGDISEINDDTEYVPDQDPPIFHFHKNILSVEETDEGSLSLTAKHLHDIETRNFETDIPTCHLNDHFSSWTTHTSDHISSGNDNPTHKVVRPPDDE